VVVVVHGDVVLKQCFLFRTWCISSPSSSQVEGRAQLGWPHQIPSSGLAGSTPSTPGTSQPLRTGRGCNGTTLVVFLVWCCPERFNIVKVYFVFGLHSGVAVSIVTSQQGSNPGWGLSVWSLHVLPVYAWVRSAYSGFLPPLKNMHVKLIDNSKLTLGVSVRVDGCLSRVVL